jgi:hypothetical protein
VLGKRFGDGDDATAGSKRIICLRPFSGGEGQAEVELMQPCNGGRAVSLR